MANRNEGEGNRTAARRYNEAATESARRGDKADPTPQSEDERRALEEAEEQGRERAKEHDPAVQRDYSRPTK